MKTNITENIENRSLYSVWFWLIVLIGIVIRLYFYTGHVFSDDAYYTYLSYTLLNGNYTFDYLGYPIFLLRIGQIGFTSLSFSLFGTNETATVLLPFLFSILNLILTYKLTELITKNQKIATTATFLIALFPTDVIFATINFPDLINVFFINVGIYFLLKSFNQRKHKTALLGGIFLFISMQIKENIYYILILFIILLAYLLITKKQVNFQISIGILFIGLNFLLEGLIYLFLHNDFFHRLTITSLNYQYSFYDFFPHTAQKLSGRKNYFRNLFDQVFLINGRAIFLRRFYLFLPIVASIQSFIHYRKKERFLLIFWFLGIVILLIAFTTSFTEFKPLDLKRSWYIYPAVMPIIILSAQFITRFKKHISILLIVIYTLGSLIMCYHYQVYFDKDNLDLLKNYLRENNSKLIYTDHFTKYSVDLIRDYQEATSERILGNSFNFEQIKKGDWVLFNKLHVDELKMQEHNFPDFSILKSEEYKQVVVFNDFIFYEKIIQ